MTAFRLLCAAAWVAPLVALRGQHDAANLPKAALVQVLVAAAFLAWTVTGRKFRGRAAESGETIGRRALYEAPLLGLVVWSAVSLLWGHDAHAGLQPWFQWAAAGLTYVTVARLSPTRAALGGLLLGVFGAAVLVAGLGLAQALFDVRWVPQAFPPASTFANKNIAAGFVVAVLPLGLLAFMPGQPPWVTRWRSGLWGVGAIVILSYVAVSLSRGAWLALGAQTLALLLLATGARRILPPAAVKATGIVVLALVLGGGAVLIGGKGRAAWSHVAGLWQGVQPSGDTMSASAVSVRGRKAIWQNTIEMVRDHPLIGVGLGNHALHYPRYANRAVPDPLHSTSTRQADFVHNDYLQVAAELGAPGALLLVWLVVAIVVAARRALAAADDAHVVAVGSILLSLVGLAADALVSFPFQMALPPFLLALLLATLRALGPTPQALASETPAPVEAPRPWLRMAALPLLVGLATLNMQRLRADRHMFRMFRAEGQNDWATAEKEARATLAIRRRAIDPVFVLGEVAMAVGKLPQARAALERVVARRPYYGNALRNLGAVYSASGMNAEAEASYRRVVDLDPRDALSHYRLGLLLEERQAFGEARQALQRAAELAPDDATYQFRLGLVSMQLGAAAEAEVALQRALRRAPNNAEFHKLMGVVLTQSARVAEAARHFARALELNPSISDAPRMRQLVAQAGAAGH